MQNRVFPHAKKPQVITATAVAALAGLAATAQADPTEIVATLVSIEANREGTQIIATAEATVPDTDAGPYYWWHRPESDPPTNPPTFTVPITVTAKELRSGTGYIQHTPQTNSDFKCAGMSASLSGTTFTIKGVIPRVGSWRHFLPGDTGIEVTADQGWLFWKYENDNYRILMPELDAEPVDVSIMGRSIKPAGSTPATLYQWTAPAEAGAGTADGALVEWTALDGGINLDNAGSYSPIFSKGSTVAAPKLTFDGIDDFMYVTSPINLTELSFAVICSLDPSAATGDHLIMGRGVGTNVGWQLYVTRVEAAIPLHSAAATPARDTQRSPAPSRGTAPGVSREHATETTPG